MRRWATGLETQRKEHAPRLSASQESIPQDFSWTRDHAGGLENPYLQPDEEEEDEYGSTMAHGMYPMPTPPLGGPPMPRTASSSSNLRQRSATGESNMSLAGIARAPPQRYPPPAPPAQLNLQTQANGAPSPSARGGDSYFSPVAESPASSRTSAASGVFPGPGYFFSKPVASQPVWDDVNRYTAPTTPRAPSRDGSSPNPHGMSARNPRGPSLPAMATQSQSAAQQQRSRSYSTPDVNGAGASRQRQPSQGQVPAVPGIPQHLHAAQDVAVMRGQTGSPRNELPIRTSSQSPGAQRERRHQHSGSLGGAMCQYSSQPMYGRQNPAGMMPMGHGLRADSSGMMSSRTVSPVMSPGPTAVHSGAQGSCSDLPLPSQLKVRVNCDSGNYVTLVVGFNITYQSLIDRIDAKLARFMTNSIGKGMLKLRYRDEDGDFVTIESDDDIQLAFSEWREGVKNMYSGGVGEIELFCVGEVP